MILFTLTTLARPLSEKHAQNSTMTHLFTISLEKREKCFLLQTICDGKEKKTAN